MNVLIYLNIYKKNIMSLFSEIKKRVFPTIIALSALSVSISAAFYSITGLSKLFAGASFEVIVMASALEFSKLVIASLLYQYWNELNKILKIYLTTAAAVLILITSVGIYGFLSGAYQETANKSEIVNKEVAVINLKKERYIQDRDFIIDEKKQLDESINELRKGLSNNQQQYKDKETGQILTTTSTANRKVLQTQIDNAIKRRDGVSDKLQSVTDSISVLDIKVLELETGTDVARELGPLKYVSELTNTPMNKIVNYLLLIIIFVFDPLAIALVIAANFAFSRVSTKKNSQEYVKIEERDIDELSREVGKFEGNIEDEKITPTEEQLNNLEIYLNSIKKTDDLIENFDKLQETENVVEEETTTTQSSTQIIEEQNVHPYTKRLVYHKRNGGNTRIDRV
jgi:hypothetical protein